MSMRKLTERLGVETYCFRNFKANQDVISKIKAAELTTVELCGMHADFSNPQKFESVAALYAGSGIQIEALFPPAMRNTSDEEPYFACAKIAKARALCVHYPVVELATFKTAEKLAEKYDIRVLIHNHGGYHWLGSSEMLDYVFQRTGPRIGLCLDTAWALAAGEDPLAMVTRFADRLHGIHIKDFVFNREGKPEDIVAGKGALNLKALCAALRKANFNGYAMLEYEGEPDNPLPAICESAAAVRKEFNDE